MYSFKDVYQYSENLNVLYVEDDLNILNTTKIMLENFFNSVDTGVDGVEGLEKYIEYKKRTSQYYDIVITDINMPRKDGLEMIKDIHFLSPNQAIIVISAYNDSQRLMELIKEGISNFTSKPLMPKQLLDIIYKVSQSVYNEKRKNDFIIEQSKLASMGEMIDTIAHQWLGPISIIKMQTEMLEMEAEDGVLDKGTVLDYVKKQTLHINHIIETLGEFRSFFRPSSELSTISSFEIVNSTLILLKDRLTLNHIKVEKNIADDININVIQNEFKHVLINIINNAIDEFKHKNIPNPKLIINSYIKDNNTIIEIIDNAGGIDDSIIDKIFEINFTTKANLSGTGMGLYLVILILEKINANIEVQNVTNGAKFTIIVKNNNI
ncbi:MAG: hybrid sensor histidine kinase/response regulator [Campylobacterota bacterium]|nr:hybrid sensor histidine kinase/response regulator [Campylobacterota bacterium]